MKDEEYIRTVDLAARELLGRKNGSIQPKGKFKGSGWHPEESEECQFCCLIRKPSYKYPFSLIDHCKTAEHVASLFKVDALDVKRAARQLVKDGVFPAPVSRKKKKYEDEAGLNQQDSAEAKREYLEYGLSDEKAEELVKLEMKLGFPIPQEWIFNIQDDMNLLDREIMEEAKALKAERY